MAEANLERAPLPDMKISVRQVFGIDSDLEVPAYSEPDEHVPDFDPETLRRLLDLLEGEGDPC